MRGSKELIRSLRGLAHLVTSQGTNIIVGGPKRPRVLHGALKCGVEWSVDVEWSETQWSERVESGVESGVGSEEWSEITPRGCSYPIGYHGISFSLWGL